MYPTTKKDESRTVRRLSERERLGIEPEDLRERIRVPILFRSLFRLVLALYHKVSSWIGFGLNEWGKKLAERVIRCFFYFTTHVSRYWVAFGRPCWPQHGFGRLCLGTGDFLRPKGTVSLAFYPLQEVRFITWRLRRP